MSSVNIEVYDNGRGQLEGRVNLQDDSGEFMLEALMLVIRHHCQESEIEYDNFIEALRILNQADVMERSATFTGTGAIN